MSFKTCSSHIHSLSGICKSWQKTTNQMAQRRRPNISETNKINRRRNVGGADNNNNYPLMVHNFRFSYIGIRYAADAVILLWRGSTQHWRRRRRHRCLRRRSLAFQMAAKAAAATAYSTRFALEWISLWIRNYNHHQKLINKDFWIKPCGAAAFLQSFTPVYLCSRVLLLLAFIIVGVVAVVVVGGFWRWCIINLCWIFKSRGENQCNAIYGNKSVQEGHAIAV